MHFSNIPNIFLWQILLFYSINSILLTTNMSNPPGTYTFIDDIGERHDVTYIAGRDTGFHVSSAYPDNPNVIGSPFHRAPLVKSETRPRGRTAVQRGLDGSYRYFLLNLQKDIKLCARTNTYKSCNSFINNG